MIAGRYERIDFDPPAMLDAVRREIERKRNVKIINGTQTGTKMKFSHVQVAVRLVGEGTEGKMVGKTVYKMYESIDIGDAKAEEVWSVVSRAIETATKK